MECYDYSGKLLRQYPLEQNVCACTFFENKVWMQQYFMRDDTSYYKLSNIDCMSGDIEDLGVFHKDYYWAGFSIASTATFSIVNGSFADLSICCLRLVFMDVPNDSFKKSG